MEVKEFRIGNLAEFYLHAPISEWIEDTIHVGDLEAIVELPEKHGFRPIPITEEWLIRFGFLNDGVTFKISTSRIRLILFKINSANEYNNNCNEFTATVYQSKQSIEICRVKHVHQLQNLFFALTGEELTTHKAI